MQSIKPLQLFFIQSVVDMFVPGAMDEKKEEEEEKKEEAPAEGEQS
jgi:hypothetical protein